MNEYLRAVYSEILKIRRTSALALTLLAPSAVVGLFFLMVIRSGDNFLSASNSWPWLTEGVMSLWAAAIMPIWIGLQSEILADLENRDRQWKHLCAMPVARVSLYLAKLTMLGLLLAAAFLTLTVTIFLAGSFLELIRPAYGFEFAFPFSTWGYACAMLFIAASSLLAIHNFISLRFGSFVPGFIAALLATSLAGLLVASEQWPFFPWRLTLNVLGELKEAKVDPYWLIASLVCVALSSALGAWDFGRRDVV